MVEREVMVVVFVLVVTILLLKSLGSGSGSGSSGDSSLSSSGSGGGVIGEDRRSRGSRGSGRRASHLQPRTMLALSIAGAIHGPRA